MLTRFTLLLPGGEDLDIAQFTMLQDLSFIVDILACVELGRPVDLRRFGESYSNRADLRSTIKLLSSGTPSQHLRTLGFICYIHFSGSLYIEDVEESLLGQLDDILTTSFLSKNITINFAICDVRSNLLYRNVVDSLQRALPRLHSSNRLNITPSAPSR